MSDSKKYGADLEVDEDPESWVLYETLEGGIARVTLNRPHRKNAILSPDMHVILAERLARANDDDEVKVIVLAGAGSDFCSGDDVRRMPVERAGLKKGKKLPQTARIRNAVRLDENLRNLLFTSKTVIAACQGAVIGAGLNLALAADLVVAADTAYFARPQARIGFAGFSTALPLVLLKMGVNRGYEAMITGRKVKAAELKDWGVVNSVVPEADLAGEALRYAKAIASHSADGLMIGKHGLHMFWELMGMSTYGAFVKMAHPLFTNLVWRDDEFNFLRERNGRGAKEALAELNKRWKDLGFDEE
ncbi:MAG: enoyl-CoA hydratase/isomerase family protein [Deltaproteobacteria bacterium]|nr:enoyl-CoA hydratase/isomerase family protein [Deltaproteobacteria bacterium]